MSRYFKCTTNKNPLTYSCGEKIIFTVTAKENCLDIPCDFIHWKIADDDGKFSEDLGSCKFGEPLILETTLDKPGFVHLTCTAFNENAQPDNSFDVLDAGAGADIDAITYCDTVPDDFDDYWNDIEKLVADFDYKVLLNKPITDGVKEGFKAFDLRISTPEGRPASGIVTLPEKEGKYPILVLFNGYGFAGAEVTCMPNTITAHFNAHGFENDMPNIMLRKKYYHDIMKNENGYGYGFDPEENASNKTTYWRNMMIRNLLGLKYIKTLPCWDGKNIKVKGGSQGALQATTVAAHDKDVNFLDINIPWFCNLNGENKGYMAGWRPTFAEGLRYFDTVAEATRVKCPVKISARLGDYVCPPSTIMTLYNSFNVNKQLMFIQSGTHGYHPHEIDAFYMWSEPENPSGEIKIGKYRHYKGGEYEVLSLAKSSENYNETVVVYKSLTDGKIWVRPAYMWNELVFNNGEYVKRFEILE